MAIVLALVGIALLAVCSGYPRNPTTAGLWDVLDPGAAATD